MNFTTIDSTTPRKFCAFVALLFLLSSCNNAKESHNVIESSSDFKLINEDIGKLISEYVKENSVNVKERLIVLNFFDLGEKQVYDVSQAKSTSFQRTHPDCFFVHDEAVVIVYLGGSRFLSSNRTASDLNQIIKNMNISLEEKVVNYDPPRWQLVVCEERVEIRKSYNPYLLDYLPCDYSLKRDSSDLNKYELVKDN